VDQFADSYTREVKCQGFGMVVLANIRICLHATKNIKLCTAKQETQWSGTHLWVKQQNSCVIHQQISW